MKTEISTKIFDYVRFSVLKKNALWNLLGTVAPAMMGVFTIPYLIRQVGLERFGILTLIWSAIGYFSLFDFGLGRALTQQVANKRAAGLDEELPSLIKTGLLLTGATGLVGGILLAATANPLAYKWLNVSAPQQHITIISLLIASLGIPLTTLTAGLRGVLEAHEDFKTVNLIRMLLGYANFGLPVLCVWWFGPRIDVMVASLVVARLLVLGAHVFYVNRINRRYLRAKWGGRQDTINLLSFGGWMTVSNIIGPLLVISDRYIISFMLGAGVVAYYTVPFEVLIRILVIPMALTAALFPRFTSLFTTDILEAKRLYKKSLRTVILVLLPICFFVAIGSFWALNIWLGQAFAQHSWYIAAVLAGGIFLNGTAQIPYAALHAAGKVKITAFIHIGELFFYIPLLLVFLNFFGLLGAAMVWVLRVGCDLLILLFYAKKSMA